MKQYKDIFIHGAQLFRHLKDQQASNNNNELAFAKLPLAASRTAARALSRRGQADEDDFLGDDDFDILSAFGGAFGGGEGEESGTDFDFLSALGGGFGFGGDEDEEAGGDFFSDFASGFGGEDGDMDEVMENMEKCGIDVSDMASKALLAFMMSGASMDFSSPESFGAFAPILLALKDDDEVDCKDDETEKLALASNEYLECTGTNQFFDSMDPKDTEYADLIQSIENECKAIIDMVSSGDFLTLEEEDILDEDSVIGKSSKQCLQTLLGDNEIGGFVRYEYDHMDKILGCFSKLGDDTPHCLISSPPLEDGTAYPIIPLSLVKKFACVVGSSSASAIEAACVGTYESLDKCLPQNGANDVDGATSLCAEEEGILLGQTYILGMDASVVTGNKMPDFCSKIFEEKGMNTKDVQSRLENFHENREYGWTLESIANGAKIEVEAGPESQAVEVSEQLEEMYKSNPVDIRVESLEWTNGEAAPTSSDHASSQSKCFPFLIGGLVIVASVVLALVVKYARGASRRSPLTSKSSSKSNTFMKEYAHVAVAVKLDDNDFA